MSKKPILVFILVFFFFGFNLARAEMVIKEIMYNPTDGSSYEWIEFFNDGNEQINLDGWRFFNSENSSTPLRTSGSFILEPNNYALIISNNSLVSFSGQIFTSSQFSLPNDSSKYSTYKGVYSDTNKTIGNSVTYNTGLGANGDGNSFQLMNDGSWKAALPTLGKANETVIPPSPSANDSSSSVSSSGSNSSSGGISTETKTKVIEIPKIKTKITSKILAFVGLPISLEAIAFGLSGEKLYYGKYFWNFGDGDSKEVQANNNQLFTHTYYYSGDYTVSLDYYQNYYSNVLDASDKMTIKVVGPDVSISRVGDEKDFFVELTNNTDYSADLSSWVITSEKKSFTIPRNTILEAKKKIVISPKITNFSIEDKNTLKLITSQGDIVFDYFSSIALIVPILPKDIVVKNRMPKVINPITPAVSNLNVQIQDEDLPALALNSQNSFSSPIIPIAALCFVGISAGGVYFIRRKKVIFQPGNDFEILDE